MPLRPRLVSAALVSLLLAACGGSSAGGGDSAHGGGHGEQKVTAPVDGAPEATVTAVDLDFEPGALELKAGEATNLTVVNKGEALHDFTLAEADIHVNVPAGNEVTTAVTVEEAGSYKAICTVPGHEDAGMVVDVTVKE